MNTSRFRSIDYRTSPKLFYGGLVCFATALLIASSTASQAAPVYGEPASLTGTRTVGAIGLDNIDSDPDWDDVVLSWTITNNGDGTFHYSYTLEDFDRPGVSHVTLDVSDDAIDDETPAPGLVTDAELNGNSIAAFLEFGDKEGITGAVKFDIGDDGDLTYTFNSNRSPVWGDIAIKGGQNLMTNTGFSNHSLEDSGHFVARPNGYAPEPNSFTLFAAMAVFVPRLLKRRKHQ
jgi:hypothetical protein